MAPYQTGFSAKLGLVVKVVKCELINAEDAVVAKLKAVAPYIKHVNTASATLLGTPINGEQNVDEVL